MSTDLSKYPWATLMVVFFAVVGGVVTLVGDSSLGFDEYLTTVLAAASALSIGRGLAYKENGIDDTPASRLLNSIPWSTVLVGVFSVVGFIALLIGESDMNFEGYITRVMAAAAVLGIGRGIASYKKDSENVNTKPEGGTYSELPEYPEDVPPIDARAAAVNPHPDELQGDIDPPQKGV